MILLSRYDNELVVPSFLAGQRCSSSLSYHPLLRRLNLRDTFLPMKFKVLEDTSNLSLRKARKDILNARNTKARNKAAIKLSDKLEQAQGFHVGGGLQYRSRARQLLKKLGNDVGKVKRDLDDLSTKRKKELGYPLTPIAERRRRRRSARDESSDHVHTYEDSENLENVLSSPTRGLALQQELKMLSKDDSMWDKRRPKKNIPSVNIIERNKLKIQKLEEERRLANEAKRDRNHAGIKSGADLRQKQQGPETDDKSSFARTVLNINEFLRMENGTMEGNTSRNNDIIRKNIRSIKQIPSLKEKKIEHLNKKYKGGTQSGDITTRSTSSEATLFSSRPATSRGTVPVQKIMFDERNYAKAPFLGKDGRPNLEPGIPFFNQFFDPVELWRLALKTGNIFAW